MIVKMVCAAHPMPALLTRSYRSSDFLKRDGHFNIYANYERRQQKVNCLGTIQSALSALQSFGLDVASDCPGHHLLVSDRTLYVISFQMASTLAGNRRFVRRDEAGIPLYDCLHPSRIVVIDIADRPPRN